LKIGIVAGEASGDLLGAKLLHALREKYPDVVIEGLGGPAMMAAGCRSLFDIERLAVMGFIEPLLRLPDLMKLRRDLYRHFTRHPPDLFIGIDAPDFNFGLEKRLRTAGIPVVHYVSPSVWAWRRYRIHKINKAINLMLTLLPFEAEFYERHHVPVRYVGHPLAEQIPLEIDTRAARRSLCVDEQGVYIALLPGSRRQEIRHMAEPLLLAAKKCWEMHPQVRFITSHVNEARYQEFYEWYKKLTPDLPLQFFTRRSHDVMAAADMVVVTSGTATLETMLYKKPMIIAYRMSRFTHWLAKKLVKTPFIGLPNLLANEKLVPELIQEEANPDTICSLLCDFLNHPEKIQILEQKFTAIHESLCMPLKSSLVDAVLSVMKTD